MFLTLFLLLATLIFLYLFLIWNFNYWTKRGIVSPKPLPYFGNFPKAYRGLQHMVYDVDDIYQKYKETEDFVGIFNLRTPQLLILNPELCRNILTDNFKHFHDNELSSFIDKRCDSITANNPYTLTGEAWNETRAVLRDGIQIETGRTYSYANQEACKRMRLKIAHHIKQSPLEGLQLKDLSLHYTAEIAAFSAFGFNFCGQPSTNLIFDAIFSIFYTRSDVNFFYVLTNLMPTLKKFCKVRMLSERVQLLFIKLMQTAIDLRKSQADHENQRDFLNHLLQLQKDKETSTMEMTTYSMNFIMHGFLCIHTVLAHSLLLLAKHPKVQQRLRSEIEQEFRKGDAVDLSKLNKLPYLDACVHETIRILPPGFYFSKICTEPIVLPNKSGRSISLNKGELVLLPSYSIMHDERLYPNSNEFRPERFVDESGSIVDDFYKCGLYYGFGAGPRECVGKYYALLQIKAALVEILRNFSFSVNHKTKESHEIDPRYYNLFLDNEVWLNFEAINKLDFT